MISLQARRTHRIRRRRNIGGDSPNLKTSWIRGSHSRQDLPIPWARCLREKWQPQNRPLAVLPEGSLAKVSKNPCHSLRRFRTLPPARQLPVSKHRQDQLTQSSPTPNESVEAPCHGSEARYRKERTKRPKSGRRLRIGVVTAVKASKTCKFAVKPCQSEESRSNNNEVMWSLLLQASRLSSNELTLPIVKGRKRRQQPTPSSPFLQCRLCQQYHQAMAVSRRPCRRTVRRMATFLSQNSDCLGVLSRMYRILGT